MQGFARDFKLRAVFIMFRLRGFGFWVLSLRVQWVSSAFAEFKAPEVQERFNV